MLAACSTVECGISAQGEGQLGLGGTILSQTVTLKNGSQHVDIVVEPPAFTSDYMELFLEPKSSRPVNYCEVTVLE